MQDVLPDHAVNTLAFPFSAEEQQTRLLEKQPGRTYIVFSVNSEAASRRLAPEKWIELGNRLLHDSTRHVMLVFIGVPKEQPCVDSVIQGLHDQHRVLNFAGKTTVRELAMLLRDADAVVANDSGPMHLANAVGAPLVTHIGAADPVETKPFNQAHTRIINKYLPCSPCVKNICPFPTVYCLEHITVDDLHHSLLAVLKEAGK
jgi:ADP-heptose:LPS heptosyltransferase